jgi:arylsulfatase A-like enzyme
VKTAFRYFALLLTIPLLLANCFRARAEGVEPRKPNVLYVIADMCRANALGCYGNQDARTPSLDKFAAEGLRLDACISTTPVCCPHRASLMSGQYAHHNGMLSNGCQFKPTAKCLGETFKEAGYEMGYVGKWHLGRADKKNDPTWGFPAPGTKYGVYHFARNPAPTTDIALKFIDEKSKGKAPWMLFVSWIWPHSPYNPPQELRDHFKTVSIEPNVPAGRPTEFAEQNLPGYYGMLEGVDRQFSRLLEALEKAGVADDTIVIFSSDHGDMIGSQGYKAKRWPYEESARVPFLIRYPRLMHGGHSLVEPFGTPDIYPTLCGLAGISRPMGVDGADFSGLFLGRTDTAPRDYVYMEMAYSYTTWPGWRAFRTKETMYARLPDKPWLLYNVSKDNYETNNLVARNPEMTKKMDARLSDMMKEYGDSWTVKTETGDVDAWLAGGPKQHSQNLGVPYPGEKKGPLVKTGGKKKKGKKSADDDDE